MQKKLGVDINYVKGRYRVPERLHYNVEETFQSKDIKIILDFITVIYDACKTEYEKMRDTNTLKEYIKSINEIFQEECMCYILLENGRVRYSVDEEQSKVIKSTLAILDLPKYKYYSDTFNEILDEHYKNFSKESSIYELFKCIEIFVLTAINNNSCKILNQSSIDLLMNIINGHTQTDILYTTDDKEALLNFNQLFLKWVCMCHKYRHGKKDQINNSVPKELFNFIFSTGISIFRFLLEMDNKYNIIKQP